MAGPNLFLVGAPRSGTTQLSFWLASHPEISMPNIKEPNFFSNKDFSEEYVQKSHLNDVDPVLYVRGRMDKVYQFCVFRNQLDYEALFSNLGHCKWRLDASTSYLHSIGCAKRIKEYSPDSKIIILLREPVGRMISHYGLAIRTGRESGSFEKIFKAEINGDREANDSYLIGNSLYSSAVSEYLGVFPKKNIMIVTFEELLANTRKTLDNIAEFLQLNPDGFDVSVQVKNETKLPRFKLLNYFMQKYGMKKFLKNMLPNEILMKVKQSYFMDEKPSVDVSGCDFEIIEADIKKLAEILPNISKQWRS